MFRSEDDGDGSDAWLPDPDLVLDPATPPDGDVYEIVVRTLLAMGLSGDHIQTLIRFILLADHGIQGVAQIWPEYGRNIANVFSKAQRGRRGKLELHLDGAFHHPSKRREVMINFSAFFCNRILKSPSAPLPALLNRCNVDSSCDHGTQSHAGNKPQLPLWSCDPRYRTSLTTYNCSLKD